MINGSTQAENITFVNVCEHKIGAPKYIKQILTDIKGETASNTIIVVDFNSPLTSIDRGFRQEQ